MSGLSRISPEPRVRLDLQRLEPRLALAAATIARVTSITVPPAGSYNGGDELVFRVTFTGPVQVTGQPVVNLTIGRAKVPAVYIGGAGTSVLSFRHVVADGQNDADGIAVAKAIRLPAGATLVDAANRPAALAFRPPNTSRVLVDTARPAVASVTGPAAKNHTAGSTLSFTVNFTEKVAATGVPALPITIGDTVRHATWNGRGSGGRSLTFTLPVQAGDFAPAGVRVGGPIVFPDGAAIRDQAGNELSPGTAGVFPRARVDAVAPRVSSFGQLAIAGKRVSIRVTFTEPVTIRGNPSIPFLLNGVPRELVYVRGAGSNVLVFQYNATWRETPTAGNVAVSTPPLSFGRGQFRDRAGNPVAALPANDLENVLPASKILRPGDSVRNPADGTVLTFRPDGNLVVGTPDAPAKWSTGTANRGAAYAVLDALGEFTIRNQNGAVLWTSKTFVNAPLANAMLVVQAGGFHIRSAGGVGFATTFIDSMPAGRTLEIGMAVATPDGTTRLEMQPDGNLVLSRDGAPQWSTGQSTAVRARMQTDGNLVLEDGRGNPVWNLLSRTRQPVVAGSTLDVVDGGMAVVAPGGRAVYASLYRDELLPGQVLLAGDRVEMTSRSGGTTELVMQPDGNLVVFYRDSGTSRALRWNSGVTAEFARAMMQADGNLVLYRAGTDEALWSLNDNGVTLPGVAAEPRLRLVDEGFSIVDRHGGTVVSTFYRGGLLPNQVLIPDAVVAGADGTRLVMQRDGLLVQYFNGVPQWATSNKKEIITGSSIIGHSAVMQDDGNLVVYAKDRTPVWRMDARAVIAPGLWVAGSRLTMIPGGFSVNAPDGRIVFATRYTGRLQPGQSLTPGASIISADGTTELRASRNPSGTSLVHVPAGTSRTVWDSNNLRSLVMQTDGNLVFYLEPPSTDQDPAVGWALGEVRVSFSEAFGTPGQRIVPGSSLVVTDNDLQVIAPDASLVWRAFEYAAPLVTGQSIALEGTRVVSPDGAGELVLSGGTLAARVNGITVWSIGSARAAVIQQDGNFVVQASGGPLGFGRSVPGSSIVWLSDRQRFALVAPDPGQAILYAFG